MQIKQLAATSNLQLAWRRITTGGNQQYKRLFRDLYVAYEVALDENLADLQNRLRGGTFEPKRPERIYLPKSSGLHRPLTVLHIEDQIVLQAFANLAAKKLFLQREPLQLNVVYSSILENHSSIFFFKRWQTTYSAFQNRIREHYISGLRWVADFDLAAFYDTVSHELLLQTIYPKISGSNDLTWFRDCLGTWSSEKKTSSHGHGIPQGPLASDFLAECFLLPIDLALQKAPGYLRYVDDVRLFGRTADDVRALVIQLERRCREHGLIPQTGKFAIKYASSVRDAMGMLPSIADPHRASDDHPLKIPVAKARSQFNSALNGKPLRVQDKTRLRYVLYNAEPDKVILSMVLRLLPRHPEHADAFFSYLQQFNPRKPILNLCVDLIEQNPYPYIRGESWLLLANYLQNPRVLDRPTRQHLMRKATALAKRRRPEHLTEALGATRFLCASQNVGLARRCRLLKFHPPLLQALAAPGLPDVAFARGEVVEAYLRSESFEPGLAVCGRIHALGRTPSTFGILPAELPSQVRNTLLALGTISAPGSPMDPIAEIIGKRYGVTSAKSWHHLLGSEYVHALGILKQAEAAFNASMSYWLAMMNSFHHLVFISLQKHLAIIGHLAKCRYIGADGKLVDFGVMLDPNGPFSKEAPDIGNCFREINTRRNQLPASHPYDKKTQKRARHLGTQERNRFVAKLCKAYLAFIGLMPSS